MTSKQQQIQNNSSVDNDSQDERLPKYHYENPGSPAGPGAPSAQESPKGAKRKSKKAEGSSLSTAISGTNSKSWISKQQELWKTEFEHQTFIERGKIPDDELPF